VLKACKIVVLPVLSSSISCWRIIALMSVLTNCYTCQTFSRNYRLKDFYILGVNGITDACSSIYHVQALQSKA
jgi:hypothetical protein